MQQKLTRRGFWKKSVEFRTRHRMRRVDFRGSQKPDKFARYGRRTRWGGRWKSQNRKNVYLSAYVEEPLNSKVIKSFEPELRSRKCFGIPMFYVYMLWTFYVRFTHIRIMGVLQFLLLFLYIILVLLVEICRISIDVNFCVIIMCCCYILFDGSGTREIVYIYIYIYICVCCARARVCVCVCVFWKVS